VSWPAHPPTLYPYSEASLISVPGPRPPCSSPLILRSRAPPWRVLTSIKHFPRDPRLVRVPDIPAHGLPLPTADGFGDDPRLCFRFESKSIHTHKKLFVLMVLAVPAQLIVTQKSTKIFRGRQLYSTTCICRTREKWLRTSPGSGYPLTTRVPMSNPRRPDQLCEIGLSLQCS
jgi:hypothetical protein